MAITETTRPVEVTRHVKERWMQRIKDQNVDAKTMATLVNRNDTQLTLEILDAYKNSQFLWQGALWQDAQACFSINEDIIFVANASKTSIMTCYKVDLPFPDGLQKEIIKKSVKTIQDLRKKITKYHDRWIPWLKKKDEEKKTIKQKIKELEEQYSQLEKDVQEKRKYTDECMKEIEEYARIICNSLVFKQEWERGLIK